MREAMHNIAQTTIQYIKDWSEGKEITNEIK